jgi:hypothetical protein
MKKQIYFGTNNFICIEYICYTQSTKTLIERLKRPERVVAKGKQPQRVVAVYLLPQRVLDCIDLPRSEIRVVAVGENDHNALWLSFDFQNATWSFSFTATTRCEVSRTELCKKVSVNEQFTSSVMY